MHQIILMRCGDLMHEHDLWSICFLFFFFGSWLRKAWWTNQMPSCYMSWASERQSCCTPTSEAPRDSSCLSHTWSAAVLSRVILTSSICFHTGRSLILNTWNDNYGASQRSVDLYAVNLNCLSDFLCSSGDQEGRLDLSHPVHVDNCLLEPETKQCWREPPAFIHRDLR